jgi:hypothetical protein
MQENAPLSAQIFSCVIQNNIKFANFPGLYFPHFTTFRNRTLGNFTNFNMLFLAVVMDFVFLA